jgi:ubiquinone/menaquinone biosynthesis C-methylase UbiE
LADIWARYIEPSGQPGPDYWNYFAERLADLATIPGGSAVLDIGTYDGNVLFKAMKKAGTHGFGVGIDIYGGGLQDGLTEVRNYGPGNVVFAQMDAASLGFLPETFHSVLANFIGWDHCFDFDRMEFTAPDRRMAEIMRVLKPGGQIGIGSWIKQCDIDWIAEAFKRHLPEYVNATVKNISSYLKENPEGYEIVLRSSGFHNISVHVETTTFISPDAVTWWQQMEHAAREYFELVPDPDKLEHFKEQVFADLRQSRSPGGVHFSKTVSFAFGAKFRRKAFFL